MQTEFKREYHINEITSELKQVDVLTRKIVSLLLLLRFLGALIASVSIFITKQTKQTINGCLQICV